MISFSACRSIRIRVLLEHFDWRSAKDNDRVSDLLNKDIFDGYFYRQGIQKQWRIFPWRFSDLQFQFLSIDLFVFSPSTYEEDEHQMYST